jgi:hypothetical protein
VVRALKTERLGGAEKLPESAPLGRQCLHSTVQNLERCS